MLGELPSQVKAQVNQIALEQFAVFSKASLDFAGLDELVTWLNRTQAIH
jgi:hypothetical protein